MLGTTVSSTKASCSAADGSPFANVSRAAASISSSPSAQIASASAIRAARSGLTSDAPEAPVAPESSVVELMVEVVVSSSSPPQPAATEPSASTAIARIVSVLLIGSARPSGARGAGGFAFAAGLRDPEVGGELVALGLELVRLLGDLVGLALRRGEEVLGVVLEQVDRLVQVGEELLVLVGLVGRRGDLLEVGDQALVDGDELILDQRLQVATSFEDRALERLLARGELGGGLVARRGHLGDEVGRGGGVTTRGGGGLVIVATAGHEPEAGTRDDDEQERLLQHPGPSGVERRTRKLQTIRPGRCPASARDRGRPGSAAGARSPRCVPCPWAPGGHRARRRSRSPGGCRGRRRRSRRAGRGGRSGTSPRSSDRSP